MKLQWSYNEVTMKLQWSYNGVTVTMKRFGQSYNFSSNLSHNKILITLEGTARLT